MSPAAPRGVLLMNLGTPDAPTPSAVRRYLREFLMDPRVIDSSMLSRTALVYGAVLPFRPVKSAAAYQKIWGDRGSPLLAFSQDLLEGVRSELGSGYAVELGMRYGAPSISDALKKLRAKGVASLTVAPLYPQYASSSTGSSVQKAYELLARDWNTLPVRVVPPFFADAGFLDAFTEVTRPVVESERPDHVLFSFHGLPERQIRKSDEGRAHCFSSATCCDNPGASLSWCYRAQCFATARGIAARLSLDEGRFTVSFQSRLGRTPWIKPYTDELLLELPKKGIHRLAVVCPSFVADCLETLEEIGIRASEAFRGAGGTSLTLVPSLNASPLWLKAVVRLIQA